MAAAASHKANFFHKAFKVIVIDVLIQIHGGDWTECQLPAHTMHARPRMKSTNMAARSLLTTAGAPLNSFQMNTPQMAAIMGAPLTEGIGHGRACLAGGDVAECCAEPPYSSAEHAAEMGGEGTFEVGRIAHRSAGEGETHGQGVEHEVAEQHADGEDEDGSVGG